MSRFSSARTLAVAGLAGLFTFVAARAAAPTTPQQRAEMIGLVAKLESAPYAADASDTRGKVMTWLYEAPDVSVTVCPALLVDPDSLSGEEGEALVSQLMFAEARFLLEHTDQPVSEKAVHRAGVEGVLRTYAAMKAGKPGLQIPALEKLGKIHADGKID